MCDNSSIKFVKLFVFSTAITNGFKPPIKESHFTGIAGIVATPIPAFSTGAFDCDVPGSGAAFELYDNQCYFFVRFWSFGLLEEEISVHFPIGT